MWDVASSGKISLRRGDTRIWWNNKEKDHLKDLGMDGRIMLE
jgi:hypothetical protein